MSREIASVRNRSIVYASWSSCSGKVSSTADFVFLALPQGRGGGFSPLPLFFCYSAFGIDRKSADVAPSEKSVFLPNWSMKAIGRSFCALHVFREGDWGAIFEDSRFRHVVG